MSKTSTSKQAATGSKKPVESKTTAPKTVAPKETESKATTLAKEAVSPKVESKASTQKQQQPATLTAPVAEKVQTIKNPTELSITISYDNIAQCAYLMWEKEGYQHGRDKEYWLRAEEQLKKSLATARK